MNTRGKEPINEFLALRHPACKDIVYCILAEHTNWRKEKIWRKHLLTFVLLEIPAPGT